MITNPKKLQIILFGCVVLLIFAAVSTFAQGERKQDHDELRALLVNATSALNAGNFEALTPLFHDNFSITTADQRLFTKLADFKSYYQSLTGGDNAPLQSINFNPTADDLTQFVGDNIGLSHGTSTDTFNFKDGDVRVMTSRWTATVFKDSGKWRVLNLHIGVNILENPVVGALKNTMYKLGIGAGMAGLVIGFLIARLTRRKTR